MGEEKSCPCDSVKELQVEINSIKERLASGTTHFALLERGYGEIKEDIKTIMADVKELKEKPARRYDNMIGQVINVVLGVLLAYIAVQLGLQ